jgi:hypothetical protein
MGQLESDCANPINRLALTIGEMSNSDPGGWPPQIKTGRIQRRKQ